jgi:hypothetical protein
MLNKIAIAPIRDIPLHQYGYTIVESQISMLKAIQEQCSLDNEQLALVTIHLIYEKEERVGQTRKLLNERTRQSVVYLLENIRSLVRKTDLVFLHEHTLHFVLLKANLQGSLIVEERLWEALLWRTHNMSEQEILRPLFMTIGHSAAHEPQEGLDDLFTSADEISKRFTRSTEKSVRQEAGRFMRQEETQDQEGKEELARLAKRIGIPYLSFLPRKLPLRVSQVVNASLAHELRCYPVGRTRTILTVAMLNPQDHAALDRLQRETGLRIFPVLTHPEALEIALKHLHTRDKDSSKVAIPLATDLRSPV